MPSRHLAAWPPGPPAILIPAGILILAIVAIACGGSAAPSSTTLGSPAPSAGSSSSAPIEPSGGASPAGSAGAADPDAGAALDAFQAFIQTDQTFRMQADMQITVGSETIDVDVAADVAAPDERAELIIRSGAASFAMELIVLDGVIYAQLANRPWQILPTEFTSANPLLGLGVEGLAPMGTVNVAGTRTHHFRVDDPSLVDPSLISASSVTEIEISSVSFDIYVTDDGRPLAAIMDLAGSGVAEGERQDVTARIRYDFSRFGEPVVIQKPPVIASPAP